MTDATTTLSAHQADIDDIDILVGLHGTKPERDTWTRLRTALLTTPQPLAIGLDREAVARVIYDDLEGPVANQDFTRQTRQWEQCLRIADAILGMVRHGK